MKTEPTIYSLLNSISYPEDLRKLSVEQLPEICKELRQDIIQELSCNPGHFAASLGTVELTVALHYVYNTPYDRIVWDVGHQAYGHKMLTGRREAFCTNRKFKGIRPFPTPVESDYDTFACGHASNSISAALGMAVAAARKGEKDRHVVAVIGDGSMSGGLAFEGLNNASSTTNNLLIILNDNDMAIDRSVGGMKQYLFNLTTSNRYNQLRFKASKMLFKMGVLNEDRRKALIRFSNSLKSMAAQQQNIFEGMNIRYFGPINGHDVKNLARILRDIKDLKGPKILHLHTVKGKGFEPAEKDPGIWHAPGRFDPETGERITTSVPNRVRRDAGRTGREKSEDSGSYSCHAHRMLHEPIDEVHARPCIRCRHCRRACSHILRRHGKGRHAALLQHLLVFHAAGIRQCDTRHCPPEAARCPLSGPRRTGGRGWPDASWRIRPCLLPPYPEPDHILAHGRT